MPTITILDKQGRDISSDSRDDEVNTTSFESMNLKEDLLKGISAYGFDRPGQLQQRAIKPMLLGKDMILQAHSGKQYINLSLSRYVTLLMFVLLFVLLYLFYREW